MRLTYFSANLTAIFLLVMNSTTLAEDVQLSPPKYNVMDWHDVNVAGLQVQPILNDISIGGSLGLSHSISSYTSEFGHVLTLEASLQGFKDNYRGFLYVTQRFRTSVGDPADPRPKGFWVLRASNLAGTADFSLNPDGTYWALEDPRYTLKFTQGRGYIFTTPNGTEVTYPTTRNPVTYLPTDAWQGTWPKERIMMQEIKYPNGFSLNVNLERPDGHERGLSESITSVNTNTGFQLKYIYEYDARPLEASKQQRLQEIRALRSRYDNQPLVILLPLTEGGWSSIMPKYTKGINNAVDFCSPTIKTDCSSLTRSWPKVTYEWPASMPLGMYIGESVFKVIDPTGGVTEYHHNAIEITNLDLGYHYAAPRIVKIKRVSDRTPSIHYSYRIIGSATEWPNDASVTLNSSWIGDDSISYSIPTGGMGRPIENVSDSDRATLHVTSPAFGGLMRVTNNRVDVNFNSDRLELTSKRPTNRVRSVLNLMGGGLTEYFYDARNNINKITENGFSTEASYDTVCVNLKTCNQANWISDAKGQRTYYTYHAESGQVATITSPPDKNGLSPVTRFSYEQKRAKFYNASGSKVEGTPIWLKVSEKTCIKTATVGDVCAGGANDEVVTRFEYNHDNLLLTGMTILATGTSTTPKRTCYQYDIYGNKIGETQPKANLASCN
jgi:hypothetical protein